MKNLVTIFLFIMIYNSAKADDNKWIIIQSSSSSR